MTLNTHPSIKTTCPYCGVGCGTIAKPDGKGGAIIEGDKSHPASLGKLCSKGSSLGETLGLETRLLYPQVNGERTTWEASLDYVASNLARIIKTYGPNSVAFYLSGQLLTEDYYIANKLMKGFIGTANVDTNSRLCMASSVVGHKRAFGSDTVPGCYEDLDEADLLVLVGSNAAWCHPVLFQRMSKARDTRGAMLINIDPRNSATGEACDMQLGIKAGSDTVLFCGLLVYLSEHNYLNRAYIEAYTDGLEAALQNAKEIAPDIETISTQTGLKSAAITVFYEIWAKNERVVTLYSQGVNQSAQGTDKVNAILNCHLATGRIGKIGMGPFSLTGQPNAMGGREVGGLANQLAAHMGFTPPDIDRVGRFWQIGHNVPVNMAQREGLKAVEMFQAIDRGDIKALWVMGTNPAVSLPDADRVRNSLQKLDLFIVSENVTSNDTVNSGAHVLLPAAAWGEKDGTVTNSDRTISRQRKFLPLPAEVKPDWWIMRGVAERLGFGAAFAYESVSDIFREHAALSSFENNGSRDFDIGALASITNAEYDEIAPVQWPLRVGEKPVARLFSEGGFFTPNKRAQFIKLAPPKLAARLYDKFPLRLNTGRVRDQWHTMTRTGLSPRLGSHKPEPYVEIHPSDSAEFDLRDGGIAKLASPYGTATLRVVVTQKQDQGSIFVPIHWNDETSGGGRIGALVQNSCDPFSGQPESKATPVRIEPADFKHYGFTLVRSTLKLPEGSFYGWAAIGDGYMARIATNASQDHLLTLLRTHVYQATGQKIELIKREDETGVFRAALIVSDRLEAVLSLHVSESGPSWAGFEQAWRQLELDETSRALLLSGRSTAIDKGATICACFGVQQKTIEDAITGGAVTIEAIGAKTKAGTKCGSCVPEMQRLVAT
jgi:assimilatory nitrate reductase catalytic subunit